MIKNIFYTSSKKFFVTILLSEKKCIFIIIIISISELKHVISIFLVICDEKATTEPIKLAYWHISSYTYSARANWQEVIEANTRY